MDETTTGTVSRRELIAGAALLTAGAARRVAVIGRTGAGDYGHDVDTVWLDVPGVEIVAVADPSAAGRAAALQRLRCERGYADYREMLAAERPELVSVAPRHPNCHREMALACAAAGVRGVLMEKPLACDLIEADAIVDACRRHGMRLAMCHQARYAPSVLAAVSELSAGRLGDVLELRARGKEDHRGGGEDMMVLGSHLFDLMRLIGGDPRWCFGRVTVRGKPVGGSDVREGRGDGLGLIAGDQVSAIYGFARGVVGHFASEVAAHGAGSRYALHVLGTKGQMIIEPSTARVYVLDEPSWNGGRSGAPWRTLLPNEPGRQEWSLRRGNGLIAADLVGCVSQGRDPAGSVTDGRGSLEMTMAVYESQRQGRSVTLPLSERRHPLSLLPR